MNIKVTAEQIWAKGMIDGKQTENETITVVITEEELIKKAKAKMKNDIHIGYHWAVSFENFKLSVVKNKIKTLRKYLSNND